MMGWSDGGWGMGAGWMFMGLAWVMIIAGVMGLAVWGGAMWRGHREAPHSSALDILKQRYARGEIDREEYEQKRRDLAE